MFAILRTKKIKDYTAFSKTMQHNLRTKFADNVDASKSKENKVYYQHIKNADELKAYYDNLSAKERVNSVKAMEFVFTASPEFFEKASNEQLEKWKADQVAFAKNEWGDKLQFLVLHNDEKSPHFHAIVSVEDTKEHKYKNQKGEFFKKVTTLNARKFDREYLRSLQSKYALANKKYGLSRGIKNSKARHIELKEFRNSVSKALEADYTKSIESAFDNEFLKKKKLGYISFDDAKAFMLHHLNYMAREVKKLKKRDDLSKQYFELSKKAKEVLDKVTKEMTDIKALRNEYFETVENGKQWKADRDYLKNKYEPEPDNITDRPVINSQVDKKMKLR